METVRKAHNYYYIHIISNYVKIITNYVPLRQASRFNCQWAERINQKLFYVQIAIFSFDAIRPPYTRVALQCKTDLCCLRCLSSSLESPFLFPTPFFFSSRKIFALCYSVAAKDFSH